MHRRLHPEVEVRVESVTKKTRRSPEKGLF
jgi:hypothetical protein